MTAMDMDRRTLLIFNRLRPMHLFKGLKDEFLVEATRLLERQEYASGQVICKQGELTDYFYILDRGKVRLTRAHCRHEQMLEPGDFFGAEALLGEGVSPYTAAAVGAVGVLRLERKEFAALLQKHPALRAGLQLMRETRAWLFSRNWDWLARGENVYLIVRRHLWLLWQRLLWPLVTLLLVAVIFGAALAFLRLTTALWIGGLLGAPVLAWIAWVYVDWGNDFYLVTNQRVVYVEKVALIYDSRTTLSMNALTSVSSETESLADRLIEYGDVSVKTLSRPLRMQAIAYPQLVAALIEEQITRTGQRARETDLTALKNAIRNRIAPPLAEPRAEAPKAEPQRAPLGQRLRRFFSFQLRFDEGDTIIYRKHWWILLSDIWAPSAGMLAAVGVVGLALAGFLPAGITLPIAALVALVLFIPAALWWLYAFQDWRNDLYQVTNDQLVDIYRKPLGRETRDSAALENIQGLRSERPTLWGRLLNFGNVTATIPGKEFTFDDVYDPPGVQEDIQRRIEAVRARKAQRDAARRREEMAEVLSAYYLATQEVERGAAPPRGA